MSAGTIVGYVTRRDGSPISGAEIWISRTGESGSDAELKPAAKTDSRGYFQLNLSDGAAADIAEVGGKLNVSVGGSKSGRTNSKESIADESRFEVTGYLIKERLWKPDV
jgi:hypothetical protein